MKLELFNDNFQNYKRYAFGFEVDKRFYKRALEEMIMRKDVGKNDGVSGK